MTSAATAILTLACQRIGRFLIPGPDMSVLIIRLELSGEDKKTVTAERTRRQILRNRETQFPWHAQNLLN